MTVKKTQQNLSTTLENTEQVLGGLENSLGNDVEASLLEIAENSEANDGLPVGWIATNLENVLLKIVGGGTPSKTNPSFFEGVIPWMTVKDMNKHILEDTVDHISQEAVDSSATNIIPAGTPIVATRMSLGKIVVANFDSAINQDLKALFSSNEIDTDYLVYWYRSQAREVERLGTGTTVKGIRLEVLRALNFPLPPLAEQTVIAQTLDTLLAQVDNIKTRLDAIPKILKTFLQSVLAAAVSGKLTEEWRGENESSYPSKVELDKNIRIARKIKWEERQLASFDRKGTKPKNDSWKKRYKEPLDGYMDEYSMTQIQAIPDEWVESNLDTVSITVTGKTPSTTKEENWNGSLPFISPSQVSKNGEILLSERMVSDLGAMNTPVLPANSILIVCIGTIGKVGLLDREAAFNQQLNALIPVDGMSNMFLYYWSKTLYDWLIKTSSAVVNAAIINKSRLSSAPCPLPSLEEQTQIVRRVEELFAFADQIEQQVKNAQKRVNTLTQSILAKAFRGELTTQWRAEHPDLISGENSAEALLVKIKEEREKLKTKKKRSTTKTTQKTAK